MGIRSFSARSRGTTSATWTKRELREALDLVLGSVPPAALLDKLPDDLGELLPDSTTFAEIIALRVVLIAATATKPETILAAGRLILAAQSKPDPHAGHFMPDAPKLPATEERRLAIARQLGLEGDRNEDDPPINGKVRR
jgi:hypothetical protein